MIDRLTLLVIDSGRCLGWNLLHQRFPWLNCRTTGGLQVGGRFWWPHVCLDSSKAHVVSTDEVRSCPREDFTVCFSYRPLLRWWMTPGARSWCWCSICICPVPEPPPPSAAARRFLWRSAPWKEMSCLWSAGPGASAGPGHSSKSGHRFHLPPRSSGWLNHCRPESCMVRCTSPGQCRTPQHLEHRVCGRT